MKKNFYITTTLPYVNADPHIGFALELVQADVIARSKNAEGYRIFFNTGTDEHGVKVLRSAEDAGLSPEEYTAEKSKRFNSLLLALSVDLGEGRFIRTTDADHVAAAQEFWRRCEKSGDIYKAEYLVKYCTGCELEKTDSELEDGKCPLHPNLAIEEREEENYFFRFSKYKEKLLDLYAKNPEFVVPGGRLHEIKNFISGDVKDFSISRLAEKMPWGVPVPGDGIHVMYVWFDALVNYISTLGWPEDEKRFGEFWPGMQVAGKDNLRQQSAMWVAMLLSAGLPTPSRILIHGFITSEGKKMSKSLGNVVDPFKMAEKYGADAVRYYLLREVSPFEDGDWSEEKFRARYNGDLANGIGNLLARTLTLAKKFEGEIGSGMDAETENLLRETKTAADAFLSEFKFNEALAAIWKAVTAMDVYINEKKPWAMTDAGERGKVISNLYHIWGVFPDLIEPFMPDAAQGIRKRFDAKDPLSPLFPRLD